jgi:glutamate-1-semialdehyde aminotransferase
MFSRISKKINKFVFNAGYTEGKSVIDAKMAALIGELESDIKTLQSDKKDLEKELNELAKNAGKEMIKISKDASQELIDLKNEWRTEIKLSRKSKEIYNKKLSQLKASELYINNYIQTQAQESISAGAKFKSDIEQIESAANKELKKIEK